MAWHRTDAKIDINKFCPEMETGILQVAEYYKQLPDDVERMDVYWYNRTLTLLNARAENQANEAKLNRGK